MRPIKAGHRGNADSYVQHYNIMDCKPGEKIELDLKTGAAIFVYNETQKEIRYIIRISCVTMN